MNTKLLNIDANAKTVKGQEHGYMTGVLYLAPADSSGTELCALSKVADCVADCLNTAGRGGMSPGSAKFTAPNGASLPDNAIQRARLSRTFLFLNDRDAFMTQFVREIENAKKKAHKAGQTLVIRPNGTSDIRWENIPAERNGKVYPNIFAAFPELQFYDYTKLPNRRVSGIANYHLTFSYSHAPAFAPIVAKALSFYGKSVGFAAVFKGKLPAHFLGREVINGDESDLRFLDAPGKVAGLKAKGRARKSASAFAVPADYSPARVLVAA